MAAVGQDGLGGGVAPLAPLRRLAAGEGDLARQGLDGVLTCAIGLIGGALLLVSCAERTPPLGPAVPPAPVIEPVVVAAVPPSPIPRAKPPVPPVAAAALIEVPPLPASQQDLGSAGEVAIKIPDQPLALDPETLVGMSERDMVLLLGQPTWTEEIPPAKTWQYGNARCRLRVFLFMEMTTRDFRTLSYELTSTDGQPNVAQQCFAELVAEAWHP